VVNRTFYSYQSIAEIVALYAEDHFELSRVRISPLSLDRSVHGFEITSDEFAILSLFDERFIVQGGGLLHDLYLEGDYVLDQDGIMALTETILAARLRPYSLTAHPIFFNETFFRGMSLEEHEDPNVFVSVAFATGNFEESIQITLSGLDLVTIRKGYRFGGSHERVGFNPTSFRLHPDDRQLVYALLRLLDSEAAEVIGFEMVD